MDKKCFLFKATCIPVIFGLATMETSSYALDLDRGFSGPASSQAEYFSINTGKRMTIRVNFISGVNRPGIHHIPDNTNLMEAVSLAGGIANDSDPSKIYVKRKGKESFETLDYDLVKLVTDKDESYPELRNMDTILIESKSKTADNLLMGLSVLGSVIAIVSGYLLITKKR